MAGNKLSKRLPSLFNHANLKRTPMVSLLDSMTGGPTAVQPATLVEKQSFLAVDQAVANPRETSHGAEQAGKR